MDWVSTASKLNTNNMPANTPIAGDHLVRNPPEQESVAGIGVLLGEFLKFLVHPMPGAILALA